MNDDLEARLRALAENDEAPVAFADVKSRSGRQLAARLGTVSTVLAVVVVAAFVVPGWLSGEDLTAPLNPTTASARVNPNTSPAALTECPTTDGMLAAPPAGWVEGPKEALVTDTAPGRIVVCAYSGVGQPDFAQRLTTATAVTNAGDMAVDLSRVQAVFADVMPCTEEFRDTDRDQFLVAVTYPNGTAVWLNASGNHCGHSITNGTFVTDDSQWAQLTQTAATGIWPTSGAPTNPTTPPTGMLECPAVGDIATSPEGVPMTVPVPVASASGAEKSLVRSEAPLSATVCGYSISTLRGGTSTPLQPAPSFLGRVALTNLTELAADLHAVKPWSGERGCTLIGGDIYRYAVALKYPDGVIWVGVEDEPNHCLPASNGKFTTDENVGAEVANAFRTGAWKGKAPTITCPDVTVGELPPVVSHVEVPAAPTVPGADGFLTSPDVPSSGYVCTYQIVGDDGSVPHKDRVLIPGVGTWLERPDALSSVLSKAKQRGSEPLVCDTITGPERRHLVHFTYPTGEIWVAVEESESGCARAWNGAFEADANLGAAVSDANGDGIRKAVDWPGTAAEGFAIPCVNSYDAQGKLAAPATTSEAARKAMNEAKQLVAAHPQELPMATYCTDGQAVQLLYVMDGTAGQAEAEQIKVEAGAWEAANPGAAEIRTVDPPPSVAKLMVDRLTVDYAYRGVVDVRYDRFTGLTVVTMKPQEAGVNLAAQVAAVREFAQPGPTESWPMEIPLRFRTGQTFTVK